MAWQKHDRRELHRRLDERWRLARPTLADAARIAEVVYGVDADALLRVSHCETRGSFRRDERSDDAVSSAGAVGPMQFMPATWAATGFGAWPRTDAFVAMLAAAKKAAHDGSFAAWECRRAA